jgi:hypothetical protein
MCYRSVARCAGLNRKNSAPSAPDIRASRHITPERWPLPRSQPLRAWFSGLCESCSKPQAVAFASFSSISKDLCGQHSALVTLPGMHLQIAVRRPPRRLMTRTTSATTSSKWIRPPATWRLKPRSHRTRSTTKIVQSITVLLRSSLNLEVLPWRSTKRCRTPFRTPNKIAEIAA